MLIAALAILALQDDAEAAFKKFEKQYTEAKSVAVRFKMDVKEKGRDVPIAAAEGQLRLKPGEKYVLKVTYKENGDHEMTSQCDGKRRVNSRDGRTTEEEPMAGIARLLAGSITRSGLGLMLMLDKRSNGVPADPETALKVSAWTLSEDGKDRVLEYTVTVKDFGDIRVKLWLTSALVPKKRVLTVNTTARRA